MTAEQPSSPQRDTEVPDWTSICGPWAGPRPGTGMRVLSLYSGAGGLDTGFAEAGFEITHAVESDRHAVATYREMVGDHILHAELPGALGRLPRPGMTSSLRPDVIIGGPPCQGFSVIGRMDPTDPRSQHVHAFLDAVRAYRPAAFCMENVKALAVSPRWEPIYTGLRRRAEALGYTVSAFVLNSADFAVPQARHRMFLIGVRAGQLHALDPVTPSRPLTVLEALSTLPDFGREGNDTLCTARVVIAKKPVMRPSPYKGSLLFNGSGRPLELDAVARTLPASMGGNGTPIIDQVELAARLADPDARVDPWVVGHHQRLRDGTAETPSTHPLRRITVEEAAVLQSFPTGWNWQGPRSARFRQVGNAVPPRLARYVALALGRALLDRDSPDQRDAEAASQIRRPSARPRSLAAPRRWTAA